VFAVLLFAAAIVSPLDIIKTAVELSAKTDRLRQNYSMTQETINRSPGKESRKTYEMTFKNGKPYRKMVLKDGEHVDGRMEVYTSSEERRFEMLRELPKALVYVHAGTEVIDGDECWVLSIVKDHQRRDRTVIVELPPHQSNHLVEAGGLCPQAMDSVIPFVMVAQALSVAVRNAASFVGPDAIRQFFCPPNSTHTSTRCCFWPMLIYVSRPMNAITARTTSPIFMLTRLRCFR
jgi:hypothetical protein